MYLHFYNINNGLPDEFHGGTSDWVYYWNGKSKDDIDNNEKKLGNFKLINLFVGANNSGKSRFLRGLIKSNENCLHISNKEENLTSISGRLDVKHHFTQKSITGPSQMKLSKFYTKVKRGSPYFELPSNYSNYEDVFLSVKEEIENSKIDLEKILVPARRKPIEYKIEFLELMLELQKEILFVKKNSTGKKVYIPILRSIHKNEYLKEGHLKETIKKNYGIGEDVFTGLEIFRRVHSLKTTGAENRAKIRKFEDFLSENFFNSKEVEITSNSETDELMFSVDG
ncbi:MAG: hypothetical protein QNJ57_02285, partial [Flavobacteriaceae bacterium]|nr:hypothetical protein [Flavobacteriaceae bacterium]